ncbi:MAG TPA: hypothetical protein VGG39_18970 [Polyangiaceae bacterium]|jgi:hypothetical protein
MGARESTRQELRDLAKLAGTMPKDRTAPPPAIASAPAPSRPALQRPPTPSSVSKLTVPPAVASIAPASRTVAPPTGRARRGGRGVVLTSLVIGLVVAVTGGVTLGRTLARRSAVATSGPATPVVVAGAPAPPPASPPAEGNAALTAVPAAVASPPPAPSPSPATTSAPLATTLATSVGARAVPPASKVAPRRSGWRPTPRSAAAARLPVSAAVATGGKDSLDEAIRKAVASP